MKSTLLLAAFLFAAQFAQSQDWTGAVNSDWNNPANWNGFPSNGDDITVSFSNYTGAMAHPVINTNSSFSPAGMLVDGGAVLTLNANLTTTDRVEILGVGTKVILNAGTLNISGGAGNARFIFSGQSQFVMTGGNLNVGQRLLFELGASGAISGGTINIAETFALIDGEGTVSSSFEQTGGIIQTDEFGFENEAGNFHPIYNLAGGTLLVSGIFLVEGVSPGAGLGELHAVGGTANFMGTVGNLAGSTMNYVFRIENTAVVNMSGATIDQLPGDSIVVYNGGTLNINGNLVWNNAGVLTGENGEVVVNANTTLSGNGIHQFPDLTIVSGKTLSQAAPNIVSVNGDFLWSGNYSQLNHVLELNGSVLQNVVMSQNQVLSGLIMNNSGEGVLVNHSLTVTDSLKWLDGILKLDVNSLTFQDNALSIGSTENSYAIGAVVKLGDDAFVFPVGSENNRFRPVGISAPTSAAAAITVNYYPESYTSVSPVQNPLQTVSNLEYWSINRTGSSDFVSVNLGWNDASASGLVDCSSISLAYWDNAAWTMVPSIASGLCNGTGDGNLQSTSAISAFGIYTIGFTEGVYQQAVSICFGETFTVGTNTYSASGTYYDLFTDVNGQDSLVVTALTVLSPIDLSVQENTTFLVANQQNATYQWVDCGNNFSPVSGAVAQEFYPLVNGTYAVIVEMDGCSDTSQCFVIDELSVTEIATELLLYPNPAAVNTVIKIASSSEVSSAVWIAIGGSVLSEEFQISSDEIKTPGNPGVYTLKLSLKNGAVVYHKIIVTT
jgi:hypothetical protein